MSGAQFVPIVISTICWYIVYYAFTLHIYMLSMRKVKASHKSAQLQHLNVSYLLVANRSVLFEVQMYIFDSPLKQKLTRDNT